MSAVERARHDWPSRNMSYSSLAQSVEHLTVNQGVTGSSPVGGAIKPFKSYAPLAQLVEQLTLNQWVPGSNPWRCTSTWMAFLFVYTSQVWLLISPAANVALGLGFESLKVHHPHRSKMQPMPKSLVLQGFFGFLGQNFWPFVFLQFFPILRDLNPRHFRTFEDHVFFWYKCGLVQSLKLFVYNQSLCKTRTFLAKI